MYGSRNDSRLVAYLMWLHYENPLMMCYFKLMHKLKEIDAGRYTCLAQNEAGSLGTDYELEVIGKCLIVCQTRSQHFLEEFGNHGNEYVKSNFH